MISRPLRQRGDETIFNYLYLKGPSGGDREESPPWLKDPDFQFAFNRLADSPPSALAGLLIVGRPLDFLGEPFLFAHLLEPAEHLFKGFVTTRLDFNHTWDFPFRR